jgi:radical SAM protein (TIGR01212 family)
MNNFKYSNTNKRYYTLDYYFKQKFDGQKVARIPINGGFTCPNIDGSKAFGGCTFCSIKGSGDYAGLPKQDLLDQWERGHAMMSKKWPNAKYIAFFQAFSNTYAPVEVLKDKFETFVELEECVGLSIATRPDCLDDEIIEYLSDLNKRTFLIIELGLQSMHDKTAELINRGHDTKCFEDAVKKLREHNIDVVVHIINGLPKETTKMMLETAQYVGNLDVQGIKIHLLHVMQDTALVNQINNGFLELMQRNDYIDLVVKQLEYLREDIVIHRLTGDAPTENFIGPIWSRKKVTVLNDIDKQMAEKDTYQGRLYATTKLI